MFDFHPTGTKALELPQVEGNVAYRPLHGEEYPLVALHKTDDAESNVRSAEDVTIVLIVVPFFLPLFQVGHFPTETFANISGLKSHSFCVRLVIDGAPSRAADTLFQLVVDTHGHPTVLRWKPEEYRA